MSRRDPATPTVSLTVGRRRSREVSREDHLRGRRLSREMTMVKAEVKAKPRPQDGLLRLERK
jgi:hypothetical protein